LSRKNSEGCVLACIDLGMIDTYYEGQMSWFCSDIHHDYSILLLTLSKSRKKDESDDGIRNLF